jgi:hypothetical protein
MRARAALLQGAFLIATAGFLAAQQLQISELVARNESRFRDIEGDYVDWIEIRNPGDGSVALAGWSLTDNPKQLRKWIFPDRALATGEFLIVTADDDPAKGDLDATFKLDTAGESVLLVSPDGEVIDQVEYPPQLPDVAWGRFDDATWNFVDPTPGEPNSVALTAIPPRIWDLTENPAPPSAGNDLAVSVQASSLREGSEITAVRVFYRINFEPEKELTMAPATFEGVEPGTWAASIPGHDYAASDMVRWRVETDGSNGHLAKEPPFKRSRESAEYYGTVVNDPAITSELPVLHWFVERESRADRRSGTQASVFYKGRFYDNIFCRTRGQSTANWPKPKYKFDFLKGNHFVWSDDAPGSEEFNVHSFYGERGSETSYLREPAIFTFLNEAGSPAPTTFYMHIRRNGGFHGLYGFVEQIDKRFLRRHGFDASGPLYKAANVPATMNRNPSTGLYDKQLQEKEPFTDLRLLADRINARNADRFAYFADYVNVPNYINVMAAMVTPFNHDQLTKNYYLYFDPHRAEWFRFPWDGDQSFPTGRENTLENWTSPLYGDKNHTQELVNNRPNPTWQNHLHANILDNAVTLEMYLRRLRTLMDRYLAQQPVEPQVVLVSGEPGATNASYSVPENADEDGAWFLPEFSASDWKKGPLGFGFETIGQDFEALIGTRLRPWETSKETSSIYLRIPFQAESPESINHWVLRMKYDDGFIAWINGVEVARANIEGEATWTSTASSHPDSQALKFEDFDLNPFAHLLAAGENLLAIQIANVSPPSSDLLVVPEIVAGNPEPEGYFDRLFERFRSQIEEEVAADRAHWRSKGVSIGDMRVGMRSILGRNGSLDNRRKQLFTTYATGPDRLVPDPQSDGLRLEFGRIDANPASGNQDAEFVEIINPNDEAVDVSGWKLEGGITFTIPPGTVIASNKFAAEDQNRLFVCSDVRTMRSRADFPIEGGSRFVVGNYSGHLSSFGESLSLLNASGETVAATETASNPSELQRFLRVTEIMYHPAALDQRGEFIELTNLSDSVTLDLLGVTFSDGIRFTFGRSVLGPKQSVVVYASDFEGGTGLSNGGERIKIDDPIGSTIAEFEYDDDLPWPASADGTGHSLHFFSNHLGRADDDDPLGWQAGMPTPGLHEAKSFEGELPSLAVAAGALEISARRSLGTDVTFVFEVSRDLQSWESWDAGFQLTGRSVAGGIETLRFAPLSKVATFFRARVKQ